jgi:hypothetical protein
MTATDWLLWSLRSEPLNGSEFRAVRTKPRTVARPRPAEHQGRGYSAEACSRETCQLHAKRTGIYVPLKYTQFHGLFPRRTQQNAMSTAGKGARPHRKGQYSCDFCRSRKLRCDRPLPCTNCVSRGKRCQLGPATGQQQPHRQQQQQQQEEEQDSTAILPALPSPRPAAAAQDGLLVEIQGLRKLVEDLEKRVSRDTPRQQDRLLSLPALGPCPMVARADGGMSSSPGLSPVSEVVAHLERISMGQSPVCCNP